jgi:hypothetical protein
MRLCSWRGLHGWTVHGYGRRLLARFGSRGSRRPTASHGLGGGLNLAGTQWRETNASRAVDPPVLASGMPTFAYRRPSLIWSGVVSGYGLLANLLTTPPG